MKTATFTYQNDKYEVSYEEDPPGLVILPDDTLLRIEWSWQEVPPQPIDIEPAQYRRAKYEVWFR